jgi:hypothetical protein
MPDKYDSYSNSGASRKYWRGNGAGGPPPYKKPYKDDDEVGMPCVQLSSIIQGLDTTPK